MKALHTGPTRSGMKIFRKKTLMRMKQKPSSVTKFGASHSGKSFTKLFHCAWSAWKFLVRGGERST